MIRTPKSDPIVIIESKGKNYPSSFFELRRGKSGKRKFAIVDIISKISEPEELYWKEESFVGFWQ